MNGVQQLPTKFLDKISKKLHTSKELMKQVEREQTILTTNRRNIRSIIHELEMDKMDKTDKVVKASRRIIDKKVELV